MNARTMMMLARSDTKRRGNEYGNPGDNEVRNDWRGRDKPYYYDPPVAIMIDPTYRERDRRRSNMEYEGEFRGNSEHEYTPANARYMPPVYDTDYRENRRIGFTADEPRMPRMRMHDGRSSHHENLYIGKHDLRSRDGMSKEEAEEWVEDMENADGTKGQHWSMEKSKALKESLGIDLDPVEFYVSLNMMYSDYCEVAKKFGVDTPEFYAHLAKSFLKDKDAVPDKLERYYEYIVEK